MTSTVFANGNDSTVCFRPVPSWSTRIASRSMSANPLINSYNSRHSTGPLCKNSRPDPAMNRLAASSVENSGRNRSSAKRNSVCSGIPSRPRTMNRGSSLIAMTVLLSHPDGQILIDGIANRFRPILAHPLDGLVERHVLHPGGDQSADAHPQDRANAHRIEQQDNEQHQRPPGPPLLPVHNSHHQ